MKPLHIGLLVVGAAIAGGLAVKMTQPPAIPAPTPAQIATMRAAADTPKTFPPAPAPPPITAPAAETKPSPIPSAAAQPAPAPVYNEAPKPAARKISKPAPVVIAKSKPAEWLPQPYSTPAPPDEPTASDAPPPPAPPEAVATAEPPPAPEPRSAPEPPAPRHVTLPTGMAIAVRLNESLSADRVMPGDTFWASLAEPLAADGL